MSSLTGEESGGAPVPNRAAIYICIYMIYVAVGSVLRYKQRASA